MRNNSGSLGRSAILGTVLAAVAVAGCQKPQKDRSEIVMKPQAKASWTEKQLRKHALEASRALDRLSRVRRAAAGEDALAAEANTAMSGKIPPQLKRKVTLDYVGGLDQLVARIADEIGYEHEVLGTEPVPPIVVDLKVSKQAVVDVLRSAGLQAGRRATLTVDIPQKRLFVKYRALDGAGDGATDVNASGGGA